MRNSKQNSKKGIEATVDEPRQTRFIPVSKWNEFHEWPPVGGMRHLIFFRNENGFAKVLKRPNRTWLIDEKAFFKWVSEKKYKPRKKEPEIQENTKTSVE
ncbi:MAG: hypothetical protein ACH350_06440 [Parachlamydiaceae bacterium]